jgi:subtilisin
VIDTGFGPSECLSLVVGVGAWLDGSFFPGAVAAEDVANHGTHVVGLLAAQSCSRQAYAGIAPAVSAFVVRVFTGAEGAGHDDIASAIEHLVQNHEVHLISLSVGNVDRSEVEQAAIEDALDLGTLVLAAAGNHGGAVCYPAAYDETVAVAAVGKQGEGSAFARDGGYLVDPLDPGSNAEGLYVAQFGCNGPELNCVAPGVDIISTVPSMSNDPAPLAGMCGTSMATPIACGALAILLARDGEYLEMGRTRQRSERARQLLFQSCRDLGFAKEKQGVGVPTVP